MRAPKRSEWCFGNVRLPPVPSRAKTEKLKFQCNVCGAACAAPKEELDREIPSCPDCGSTVRMRAIVYHVSVELFGKSLTLADFPRRPDITGIGLSDWEGYARRLAEALGYVNTFYHQEPQLDILNVGTQPLEALDFLISSDVFEHVPPPPDLAFVNARRLLKPGGMLILTVPYNKEGRTLEHFPNLHRCRIETREGGRVLINETRDGRQEVFNQLVFHGGDGSTLEMRVFSEGSLLECLSSAGFNDVRIHGEPVPEIGVLWRVPWSLPITARRPNGQDPAHPSR